MRKDKQRMKQMKLSKYEADIKLLNKQLADEKDKSKGLMKQNTKLRQDLKIANKRITKWPEQLKQMNDREMIRQLWNVCEEYVTYVRSKTIQNIPKSSANIRNGYWFEHYNNKLRVKVIKRIDMTEGAAVDAAKTMDSFFTGSIQIEPKIDS